VRLRNVERGIDVDLDRIALWIVEVHGQCVAMVQREQLAGAQHRCLGLGTPKIIDSVSLE